LRGTNSAHIDRDFFDEKDMSSNRLNEFRGRWYLEEVRIVPMLSDCDAKRIATVQGSNSFPTDLSTSPEKVDSLAEVVSLPHNTASSLELSCFLIGDITIVYPAWIFALIRLIQDLNRLISLE
jgi:hypothetical protein